MNSKELDKLKADISFKNIVSPFLKSHGYTDQQISCMLPRVQFYRDYKDWTIRLEDNKIDDVPEIEKVLRYEPNSNRLILQAFVHDGRVMSYGVIPAAILSKVIKDKSLCTDIVNRLENVCFRCFSFSMAKQMFGNSCYVFNA